MRNNQNLPNRRIDSNSINGRQLPSTSPIYNNSRSRTPYRSQSRNSNNNKNNNTNPRDNRNYQGYRKSNNYNNRSTSYNRNNYSRNRSNSYNRNNNYNRYNNSRSSSRYTDRNNSRQQSSYNKNNSYNSNNRQRYNSRDSSRNDKYRQRSNSNNRHYSNNNNKDDSRNQSQKDSYRHYNKERRNDGNRYNNNNNNTNSKNRINNVESDKQNDDPPGIDEYEYTSESSDEDQEILDKVYIANEDTCNTIINTLESNPTWILPMYQCNKFEQDFTKQKPILEIDFLLDSGAILNLLNEDTWNEIKYNNPEIHLEKANKTLTAANNTTIETFGTVTLTLTPDRISSNRNKPQNNFHTHFYVTQCNHNILGTPFLKEYIETINVNTNRLTLNTNTILDIDIIFYMNSTKGYPYCSRLYPIFNRETIYIEQN